MTEVRCIDCKHRVITNEAKGGITTKGCCGCNHADIYTAYFKETIARKCEGFVGYPKLNSKPTQDQLYVMYTYGDLQLEVIHSDVTWSDGYDSTTDLFYFCKNLNAVLHCDDANSAWSYAEDLENLPEEVKTFIAKRGL